MTSTGAPKEIGAAGRRTVRSYVLRNGRMTTAQERAWADIWPRYGIDSSTEPLDLLALFGPAVPCTLEIGFGNGEHLVARAIAQPERNFIGVEVHRPGVGQLLIAAEKAGVSNLRVICQDAIEVLQRRLAPGALDEVQLLFPDPWPKARHHKRRIVQDSFVTLVADRLQPGGRFLLATDWVPYAEHMLEVLERCPALLNAAGPQAWSERPAYRAATRFESRGARLGHEVRDLAFLRR
jgi:tRNA (guanine-N7-)-methyltransferase